MSTYIIQGVSVKVFLETLAWPSLPGAAAANAVVGSYWLACFKWHSKKFGPKFGNKKLQKRINLNDCAFLREFFVMTSKKTF